MNWLAHLHLSEPNVEFRLGNVIADLVKGEARQQLPHAIKRGTACHLWIDAATDAHPIFLRSRQRISRPHRKFASVLIDIFYDHFLCQHWHTFCAQPLDEFIDEVYASFIHHTATQQTHLQEFVGYMTQQDWLREYQTIDGIERTLARVSRRLKRPNVLVPMLGELRENYAELNDDFLAFYPQLQNSVAQAGYNINLWSP